MLTSAHTYMHTKILFKTYLLGHILADQHSVSTFTINGLLKLTKMRNLSPMSVFMYVNCYLKGFQLLQNTVFRNCDVQEACQSLQYNAGQRLD